VRWLLALSAAVLLVMVGSPGVAAAAPGPPDAPEWWFDSWQIPALWSAGANGHGITIAEIDTGVQADLPELRGKILAGADFAGNNSDGRTDYDEDDFAHGTAMSSLMVASKGFDGVEGLAPGARILPIVVPLEGVKHRGEPSVHAGAQAIDYAVSHGAKIISMSLGGISDRRTDGPDPCPKDVQQAVVHAVRRGILVVAASGNSGDENSPVEEPGVCLGVVSVGAVDRGLNVTSFSSRHPYLTLSAPGDDIPTLSRDAVYVAGGTSHATALTSAALALIWSKYPTESDRQILTRLLNTATDRGQAGRDSAYGYGVINPAAAIAAPVPSRSAANSVLDGVQPLLPADAGQPKVLPAAGADNPSLGSVTVSRAALASNVLSYLFGGLTLLFLVLALLLLGSYRRRLRSPALPG
jgi:subtilisin family serine protease